MTTPPYFGVVRSLLGLGLLLAAGCLIDATSAQGQEREFADKNIQWNLVPLNKRNVWPLGDWQPPIRRERLEKLRLNTGDPVAAAPHEFPIRRAVYSATLTAPDVLKGNLEFTVDRARNDATMIALDPLSLPVTDLAWPDRDAVWGSTPAGKLVVQSRGDQKLLTGRWTLRGDKRPGGLLFDAHVARAAASRLTLTLPETYEVKCETAVVDVPHAADTAGWRTWQIELGRQTRCRVMLFETSPNDHPVPLVVLSDNIVNYTSAPEQFRIQNQLRLDILNAPLTDLEFVTEPDVQIHAVLAGGDAALPIVQQTLDDRQIVRVHFDPPLSGPGHVLQVQATAPLTMERQIHLPRMTVSGAIVGQGRINVIVPAPFELQKITTPADYRQDNSIGPNSVAFQYYGAERDVTAVFGWPRAEVSCRSFSHLRSTRDQWEAQTQMLWQCQSGRRFTLQCEFPAEWDVTAVSLQSNTGKFVAADDWSIVPGAHDTRTLVIKLSESLSATNPVTVELTATRPMTAHHETLAIPAPMPLDTEDVETLVSVADTNDTQPTLEAGTTFSPVSKPRVPSFWKQFSLWDTDTQTDWSSLVFLSAAARPKGQFQFQSDQTPLNVTAKVHMSLFDDRAEEVFEISSRATVPAVSQVLIFVNEQGPEITWQLSEADATTFKARKLATSRHHALGLPRFGELWEIEFASPVAAFSLSGGRTRAFSATVQASLVFVPRAKSFQGTLEVVSDPKIQPRFISKDLVELQDVDPSPRENQAGTKSQRWSYRSLDSGLRIETQLRSSGSPAAAISSVKVHSQISSVTGGENRHWAVVDLTGLSDTVELEWTLPESATPGGVQLGDQTVEPFRVGESFRLQRGARDQAGLAVIHYRTPSEPRFGPGIIQIPVPEFSVPVLQFSWIAACPPRSQLQILNANARTFGNAAGNSWGRRFLGPLAQQPAFAPTQPAKPSRPGRHDVGEGDEAAGTDIPDEPPGWQSQTFEFAMSPAAISVAMWDVDRSRFIAVALLMGCLSVAACIRACGLNFSRRFVTVWLVLAAVVATWVPAAYAEIAGGIVIGSLLACLIPLVEKLIIRDRSRPDDPVSLGSTRKYIPIATAIVLASLCLSRAMAQEPTTTSDRSGPQSAVHRVLVPYEPGDPLGRNAKWVYVEPHTLAALDAGGPEASGVPQYLFRSARYDLTITQDGGSSCNMRFEVDVLTAEDVTIQLPLENVNLRADNPCRVNGTPHPIWRESPNGNLTLRLNGSKPPATQTPVTAASPADDEPAPAPPQHMRYQIDLSATIANLPVEKHNTLRWNIPRVADSLLTIHLPAALPFARVELDRRPPFTLHRGGDNPAEAIFVGNAEHVDVVSSTEPISTANRISVSAACLADVTPSLIQYQAEISYRVRQGFINHLQWRLPPDVAVASIHGKYVAGYHVLTDSEGNQTVIVELDALSSDQIDLLAKFVLPVTDESNDPIVPALDFSLQGDVAADSMSPAQVFAVTAPPEFDLEIAPADTDMAEPLDTAAFLERWKGSTPQPRAVYATAGLVDFDTHLNSLTPTRSVKTVFRGRISRHHLDWELTAQMNVGTALAFQHRMQIDPRLRIESISVQQADAERLRRATRTRDQLVLFLKTGATGDQTIRIKGTMSLKFPGEFTLPAVGFFDAGLTDAEVILWQENDLTVTLSGIDANLPAPIRDTWELFNDNDLLVGRYQIPAGTDMEQVIIKIDKNAPEIVMDTMNLLDMRVGVQRMTTKLRFQVTSGHASEFAVRLPKQLADTCEVVSPTSTRKEPRDDGLELTFLPDDPRQQDMVALLNFPIELDANGELVIDEIFPINATVGDVFVQTLADDESFIPATEYSGLTEQTLPDQFTDWIPVDTPAAYSKSYRGGTGPWRFRSRNNPSQDALTIELADTRLWLDHARGLVGHTSFLIMPGDKEQFDVTLPSGAELRAVLTDHGLASVSHASGQDVTITLDSAQVGQQIMLYWARPAPSRGPVTDLYRRMDVPTPQPRDFVVKQTALTVIPAAHIGLEGGSDDRTPLEYAMLRLEAEFKLCRAQTNAGHPQLKYMWQRLESHYQQVAQLFNQNSANIRGENASRLRTQFADLEQRITNQLNQLPALEIPVLAVVKTPATDPAATDISSPNGSLHEYQIGANRQPDQFTASVYDERLFPAIATIVGILLVVAVRRILRRHVEFDAIGWLLAHPRITWTAVGLFWWQFMIPSWLGLVIVAIAVISRFYPRKKAANASTELDFLVGTSSNA